MLFYRSLITDRPETGGHNNNYDDASLWSLDLISGVTSELIVKNGNINTLPRWSRDGTTLYFHRFVFGGEGQFKLASIKSDGSNLVTLTAGGAYDDTDADWFR